MKCGIVFEDIGYNAPEVILGLPLNEAIDMWSLGCVLAYACMGDHLYPRHCQYQMMRIIVQMQGQPDDHLLNTGMFTEIYFNRTQDSSCASWRLNSPDEYNFRTGYETGIISGISDTFTGLDDICVAMKKDSDCKDTQAFLSLLKSLLQLDPEKRITPTEALRHCFITGGDINDANDENSPVLTTADSKLMLLPGEVISWNESSSSNSFPACKQTTENDQVDLHIEDILYSQSSRFKINEFIGKGAYGKVAHCINLHTRENLAIKIMPKYMSRLCVHEFTMLQKLQKLDVNKNNLLAFIELFSHERYDCLIFEMLDKNLFELLYERALVPLSLSEVRVIAQQMLVALNTLRNMGVAHTDIKPDNIMLVNHKLQPFKLKLIDFGLARPVSELKCGKIIQPTGYRAPEIILGLPPDAAVDMWSLGCILAFLLLAENLYPSRSEYEVMRLIVQMLGQPDDRLLNLGLRTGEIFTKDSLSRFAPWRMKTPSEYIVTTGSVIKKCRGISSTFTGLDDIVHTSGELKDFAEFLDTQAFLSLIKSMLRVDPEKRITPRNALKHSFITMDHFGSHIQDNYVKSARLIIENCQREQPTAESMLPVMSAITSSKDPCPDEEDTPTDTNNGMQLDKATAAGPSYRPAAVTDRTPAGNDNGPPVEAGLAEAVADFPRFSTAATADRRIAGKGDEPPAQAGSAEAAAAVPDYRVTAAADRTNAGNEPPAQAGLAEAVPAGNNNNPSNFVKVKTKKKLLKRIRRAFSSSKPPVMSGKDKETTMDNNNGIPSGEATAAGPSYRPATVTDRTPAGNGNRPLIQACQDEAAAAGTSNNPSDFVEVKTKHKWLQRVRQGFSRMVKSLSCCC
ncbi:homeodomain-interacting protein kinase 2-like [Larimichthys crocea]|uniref:homeodomain-interacting protein kinase 2-like n=1 Tax=Larimichthys crocea TaxID=215358 RepID=UPI000F601FDC|nr:homeodomain-interacting protein kinase 2-like [Larimichthys crocea]